MGELPSLKRDSIQPSIWVKSRATATGSASIDSDMVLMALPEIKGLRAFEPMLIVESAPGNKFKRVEWKSDHFIFLPDEELLEVLRAGDEKKRDLIIAAALDWKSRQVILIRGDMNELDVPFDAFPPSPTGTAPIFENLAVIDFGQTVQLGDYEASTDALLHEFDVL